MKKNRFTFAVILFILGCVLGMGPAGAATTVIWPGPETPLVQTSGILDQVYGLGNLVRVDDNWDQIWSPSMVDATAKTKLAAFGQDFGYIPQNIDGTFNASDFVSLFNVAGGMSGTGLSGPNAFFNSGNTPFIWALNPSGAPMWTSRTSDNTDEIDHMVTWSIVDNDEKSDNPIGRYVIAWEDLKGGGDRDFNDLVVEVHITQVPLPGAIWFFSSGLIGIAGFKRNYRI